MYARTTEAPVLLLGTAHVVDLAGPIRSTLADRPLDGIAVELDAERAQALLAPEGARRGARAGTPLLARLWGMIQRRLGAELGSGAGQEMRVAAEFARERHLPLFLIDDPIRATLASLLTALPVRERVTLLVGAILGLFVPARTVRSEMDHYADDPIAYTAALREASPTLARVLLDERNEHMADRLASVRARGYGRLAAVVGDAHVAGLSEALRRRGVPVEAIGFAALRAATAPSSSPS